MGKEYAVKIENSKHDLIFHMSFTPEEAKDTNIWIGTIEMVTENKKRKTQYIDARYMSIKDLHTWAYEK